jgi:hypothetical protein
MHGPRKSSGGRSRRSPVLPMKAAPASGLLKSRQAHSKTRARGRFAAVAARGRRPYSCRSLALLRALVPQGGTANTAFRGAQDTAGSASTAPAGGRSGVQRVSFQLWDGVSTRPRLSRPERPAFMGLRPIPRRLGRLHQVREYLQILTAYYLNTPPYTSCTVDEAQRAGVHL